MPDQPTATPTRKVLVGVAAGSLMTIVAWAAKEFAGVVIPAEVALAASTVLVFIVQYAVPNAE